MAGGLNAGTEVLMNQVRYRPFVWPYNSDSFAVGGAHHPHTHGPTRILPRRRALRFRPDAGMFRSDQVFRNALPAAKGQHEQGGARSVLSGGWDSAHRVRFCQFVLVIFWYKLTDGGCRILQKHIKRQIISLNGGFRVIADLNTYHAFISSLKVYLVLLLRRDGCL